MKVSTLITHLEKTDGYGLEIHSGDRFYIPMFPVIYSDKKIIEIQSDVSKVFDETMEKYNPLTDSNEYLEFLREAIEKDSDVSDYDVKITGYAFFEPKEPISIDKISVVDDYCNIEIHITE